MSDKTRPYKNPKTLDWFGKDNPRSYDKTPAELAEASEFDNRRELRCSGDNFEKVVDKEFPQKFLFKLLYGCG